MRKITIIRAMDEDDAVEVTAHEDELTIVLNPNVDGEVALVLPAWAMEYLIPEAMKVRQFRKSIG